MNRPSFSWLPSHPYTFLRDLRVGSLYCHQHWVHLCGVKEHSVFGTTAVASLGLIDSPWNSNQEHPLISMFIYAHVYLFSIFELLLGLSTQSDCKAYKIWFCHAITQVARWSSEHDWYNWKTKYDKNLRNGREFRRVVCQCRLQS